jgi:hypothetical protein
VRWITIVFWERFGKETKPARGRPNIRQTLR